MATLLTSRHPDSDVRALTSGWGSDHEISLYLGRCQVDTPQQAVKLVWQEVLKRRANVGRVIDFGAGDGRFGTGGKFHSYIGYEIDPSRGLACRLPENAIVVHRCAFSEMVADADLCIGNPPYVRNQDLPRGWREKAAGIISERTGLHISGLANAWMYFFALALASTRENGMVALVIPYEWVSRPSAAAIRDYIKAKNWRVQVYRLHDDTFPRVLTTSSITIVDKAESDGVWEYFRQVGVDSFEQQSSITATSFPVLAYGGKQDVEHNSPFAKRGLSPGTQKILTLTEAERARYGLRAGVDVVPCITTMRHLRGDVTSITETLFKADYVNKGKRCWLINTARKPSKRLQTYLDSVPPESRSTSTCTSRDVWWKFVVPQIPALLVSTGFVTEQTKVAVNAFGVHAVGGVCGIYSVPKSLRTRLAHALRAHKVADEVVPHANGLMKLEINQLNSLIARLNRPLNGVEQ